MSVLSSTKMHTSPTSTTATDFQASVESSIVPDIEISEDPAPMDSTTSLKILPDTGLREDLLEETIVPLRDLTPYTIFDAKQVLLACDRYSHSFRGKLGKHNVVMKVLTGHLSKDEKESLIQVKRIFSSVAGMKTITDINHVDGP